jgi:hypothetical protein
MQLLMAWSEICCAHVLQVVYTFLTLGMCARWISPQGQSPLSQAQVTCLVWAAARTAVSDATHTGCTGRCSTTMHPLTTSSQHIQPHFHQVLPITGTSGFSGDNGPPRPATVAADGGLCLPADGSGLFLTEWVHSSRLTLCLSTDDIAQHFVRSQAAAIGACHRSSHAAVHVALFSADVWMMSSMTNCNMLTGGPQTASDS